MISDQRNQIFSLQMLKRERAGVKRNLGMIGRNVTAPTQVVAQRLTIGLVVRSSQSHSWSGAGRIGMPWQWQVEDSRMRKSGWEGRFRLRGGPTGTAKFALLQQPESRSDCFRDDHPSAVAKEP
jgi:hypothetical protein